MSFDRTRAYRALPRLAAFATLPLLSACGAPEGSGSSTSGGGSVADSGREGVIARIQGEFDGTEFHITVLPGVQASNVSESDGEKVAQVQQPILDAVTSQSFGTGVSGTGTDIVALEQISRIARPGAVAWPSTCGPDPGASPAVCATIRMRNLFTSFDISRAYVRLVTLSPGTGTTSVTVEAPSPGVNETATPDFGASGVSNGLWRYGLIGFQSPTSNGPERSWLFTGTTGTPGDPLRFTFSGEVIGKLQRPTVRASLADGTLDAPTYYGSDGTAKGAGATGTQISQDGRYVVFTSSEAGVASGLSAGNMRVYRKDLTTGAVHVVNTRTDSGSVPGSPAGCYAQNPTMSTDGQYIAFESNCAMGITASQPVQVYLRDMNVATSTLVSRSSSSASTGADATATTPQVSGNGQFVVFETAAANITPAGTRPSPRALTDVYRFDNSSGTVLRANVPDGLSPTDPSVKWPNNSQNNATISDDGSLVAFDSPASNVMSPNLKKQREVYLYEMGASLSGGTASMLRMSATSGGNEIGQSSQCANAILSGDGSAISMRCIVGSTDPSIVPSPSTTALRGHYYVRDTAAGAASSIIMVDVSTDGTAEGSASVSGPAGLSNNGRFVVFGTQSTNLRRSTGCSPACLVTSASISQIYVFDRFAVDPELQRNFAVSLIRRASATSPNSAGLVYGGVYSQRLGIGGEDDNLFVAYSSRSTGSDWNQIPLSGKDQIYVSPVGDPQFE
jgi:hypothetical protein